MPDQISLLNFLDSLSPEDRNKAVGYIFGFVPAPAPTLMRRTSVKISNLGTVEEIMERIAQATGYSITDLSAEKIARQMIDERENWLSVTALTAANKKFLENQQPKATADKFEELTHLGRFVLACQIGLEIVVPNEPILYPDFLVTKDGNTFGIEHTRLIDGEARARIKIVQQFLEKAHQLLTQLYPQFYGSVNVFIDYTQPVAGDHNFDNKKFTAAEREQVTHQIANYIYSVANQTPINKPQFIDKVSYLKNPEARLDISLGENYISKDGFEKLIMDRIDSKEKRLSTYIKASSIRECWLLIVADGVSSYSGFDMETVKFPDIEKTDFDAIVLLEAFSHRLFWLKKPNKFNIQ
jgi:hypothetical protein